MAWPHSFVARSLRSFSVRTHVRSRPLLACLCVYNHTCMYAWCAVCGVRGVVCIASLCVARFCVTARALQLPL